MKNSLFVNLGGGGQLFAASSTTWLFCKTQYDAHST